MPAMAFIVSSTGTLTVSWTACMYAASESDLPISNANVLVLVSSRAFHTLPFSVSIAFNGVTLFHMYCLTCSNCVFLGLSDVIRAIVITRRHVGGARNVTKL